MLIYLDVCVLKRPFDDQAQDRIARETAALFEILTRVRKRVDALAWSGAISHENAADPDEDSRNAVEAMKGLASMSLNMNPEIGERVLALSADGVRPLDAAHVALAESGGCSHLITCDDRLIQRMRRLRTSLAVLGPLEYLMEVGHDQTNG